MRARWYDPAVGRFISEDQEHDGSNWFDYARSAPTEKVDRNGHSVLGFVFAIIIGLALVSGIEFGLEAGRSEAMGVQNPALLEISSVLGGVFGGNIDIDTLGPLARMLGWAGEVPGLGALFGACVVTAGAAFAVGFMVGFFVGVDTAPFPTPPTPMPELN
jgi:hypothetical protein